MSLLSCTFCGCVFFFKQKTAYEVRISDWSSDVCSSDLEELPASLLVVGGGYVGAEIGQIFARAGVAVTIVCRSRLLPAAEPEIGEALTRYLAEDGIRVIGGIEYHAAEKTESGIRLREIGRASGRERGGQ